MKTYLIDKRPPEALAIYCNDPRFQKSIQTFLTEDLRLHYAPLALIGSFYHFGSKVNSVWKVNLRELIVSYLEKTEIKKVVAINHDDCWWYLKNGVNPRDLKKRTKEDLYFFRELLNLPEVEIILYQLEFNIREDIFFREVS